MTDPDPTAAFLRYRDHGDAAALDRVVRATERDLAAHARALGCRPDLVADVVQQAWLAAIQRRATFDAGRPIEAWLRGLMRVEWLRARDLARRAPDPERLPPDRRSERDPYADLHASEVRRSVARGLAGLPSNYRSIVELRLRDGLEPREIATRLRASPATVRVRLHRGISMLREALPAGLATAIATLLGARSAGAATRRGAVVAVAAGTLVWCALVVAPLGVDGRSGARPPPAAATSSATPDAVASPAAAGVGAGATPTPAAAAVPDVPMAVDAADRPAIGSGGGFGRSVGVAAPATGSAARPVGADRGRRAWLEIGAGDEPLYHAAVTADRDGSLVTFGGLTGPVGERFAPSTRRLAPDGRWQAITTATSPSPRGNAAMAPHPLSGDPLLFGGGGAAGVLADTWLLETGASGSSRWRRLDTAHSPEPRRDSGLVHDPARRVLVLHGGTTVAGTLADTWEFDGADWRRVATRHAPPARRGRRLVAAADRGVVWAFGGRDPRTGDGDDDVWEYDGTDWRRLDVASGPGPRFGHALAWDPARGVAVLFGGAPGRRGASGSAAADTWEFDGTRWRRVAEHAPGGARIYPALCFDPLRGAIVSIGGVATASRRGTVLALHDAAAGWHECAPACGPSGRAGLGMTVRPLARGTRLELDPGLRGAAVPVVLAMLPASAASAPACDALPAAAAWLAWPAADAFELPVGGPEFAGCDTALRAFVLERRALRASAAWSYRP